MLKSIVRYANGREVYIIGLTPLNIAKLTTGAPILVKPESLNRGPSYPELFICFGTDDEALVMLVAEHFNIGSTATLVPVDDNDHLPAHPND